MSYQSDTTATGVVDILELIEAHTAPLECCDLCGCLCRAFEVCPSCHTITLDRVRHGFAHTDESVPEACLCGAAFVDGFHLDLMKRAHLEATR